MTGHVRTLILLVCLAFSLSGCASAMDWIFETNFAERSTGRRIAEQRCASCHSIDGRTPNPTAGARNFSQIAQRYTGRSLGVGVGDDHRGRPLQYGPAGAKSG